MLATVIASIVVFALLFTGMAIGSILANKPVKGSCGGLATLGISRAVKSAAATRTPATKTAAK